MYQPTAIRTTVAGLRAKVGKARIIAVLEPRSNTMRLGIHKDTLGPSLAEADEVLLFSPADLGWDATAALQGLGARARVFDAVDAIVRHLAHDVRPGDHVLIMSNGAFGGLHEKLLRTLEG